MSESSGSSYSTGGAGSVASDNTDSRALNALTSGSDVENSDDVDSSNKTLVETIYCTLHTLTKNKSLDASVRIATLRVTVEFLQLFLIQWWLLYRTFVFTLPKGIDTLGYIQWLLFKVVALEKGYGTVTNVLYFLAATMLVSTMGAFWVSWYLKNNDTTNTWLNRVVAGQQLLAMLTTTVLWPATLDYFLFFWNCSWNDLAEGAQPRHMIFQDKSCTAMPHLVHMMVGGACTILWCGMTLLMSVGSTDLNPLTRSILASSDAATSFKLLGLKILLVIFSTGLEFLGSIQAVLCFIINLFICYYHIWGLPYYNPLVNMVWSGLWVGLLYLSCLTLGFEFTVKQHLDDPHYGEKIAWVFLYGFFPVVALAAALVWGRMCLLQRLSQHLHAAFEDRRSAAIAASNGADAQARAAGASVVTLMGDLRSVYRFKRARHVSIMCRDMRRWDEDGVPDPEATEFGEFVLKCGMARMPNNPELTLMFASFLIEVRKDGQAARTQMQLAQKANPSWLDSYHIYIAQQLAKQLKRDGDGLDLLSYVEFQRNMRSCVRAHRLALMSQRQFWNTLLSDKVAFKDLKKCVDVMELTEQRATTVYRSVLERYPNNGKLLKVYGRFLEYVRNDPWTAAKYYEEALKQGTGESLLNLTAGQNSAEGLSAVGAINEKVDGLVIINAQGIVLMVNSAVLGIFGYGKGELEGKNVSVLMPQPFSTHHSSFLKRYVDSGQIHILNKTRSMVALHKDRSLFPISLCATRLSGIGADTLFMGVIRRSAPAAASDGQALVRFWTTTSGIVMCADRNTADCIGIDAATLVGQPFSNLCTDVEGVNRFIAAATNSTTVDGVDNVPPSIQAQLLHSYLPPLNVELSVQLGGAVDNSVDCRSIIVQACVLSESAAMMVLDHKGRVVYATDKLSAMLGYPVATLTKMELNALLPQPYCQMHGAWFKDLSKKPSPNSCRAGGVVQLLASNGTKVPVTLKMSTRDDAASGRITHVVQVERASEAEKLDQQRLLLSINHRGTILAVNSGAPKSLYGFNPDDLLGRPLAAVVDVFGLWRHEFGDDSSLLALLATHAMSESGSADAGGRNGGAVHSSLGSSWRVGVHLPVKRDEDIAEHAEQLAADGRKDGKGTEALGATAGATGSLLHALQQRNRLRAACMSLELLLQEESLLMKEESEVAKTALAQVCLYRADCLTAVLELDKHLTITRADDSASLMFGVSSRHLLKKSFARLVGLPAATTFEDLLGTKGASAAAKKGAMKGSAAAGAAVSRMGVAKRITTAHHLGDGNSLTLEVQAMSYEQGGKAHMVVRLQLQEPCSSGISALLQLKEGKAGESSSAAKLALVEGEHTVDLAATQPHPTEGSHGSRNASSHGSSDEGDRPAGRPRLSEFNDKELFDSFKRTSDWVREASKLPSPAGSPRHKDRDRDRHEQPTSHRGEHSTEPRDAEEAVVYVSAKQKHRQGAGGAGGVSYRAAGGPRKQDSKWDDEVQECTDDEDGYAAAAHGAAVPGFATAGAGSVAESASVGGGSSMNDGASEAGGGSVSSAAETGQDEDLAVDTRRAKRLRKLNRMVQSNVAQIAATAWRRNTLLLLGIILVAHVACFAVLTSEVTARYENAEAVASIAHGLDRFQAITLRANLLQKCNLVSFQDMWACDATNMATYMSKLRTNIELSHSIHQSLYLGSNGLQPFRDPRLLQYWTYKNLPEMIFFDHYVMPNGTETRHVLEESSRTLWEMGNVLVSAAQDLLYSAEAWGAGMNETWAWRYIFHNGPAAVFEGYAWSLDVFVDFAWQDLTQLSITLIALLVVEAVAVQLSCMAYEFYLVQQCNVSHMRLFSVFLALPSATTRLMAQRQLQVDDDTKEELDEDEMEMADTAAAAAAAAAGGGAGAASGANEDEEEDAPATAKKLPKSVRLVADDMADEDADADGNTDRLGKGMRKGSGAAKDTCSSGKVNSKAAGGKAAKEPQLTGFAAAQKALHKKLFGWLDPHFKRNGKTLVPSSTIILRIMVPLLIWMAAVVVIFAISYSSLQGLQGPLASLDTASHVLYRLSRSRLMSNMLAFSEDQQDNAFYRDQLKQELTYLRSEYSTLMYGGRMMLKANVTFDAVAPAGAFSDGAIAGIFYKTTACLRHDQSTCIEDTSDPNYGITHSGIDAMLNRYIDEMTVFASLPDNLAYANHSSYEWALKVAATDLYDGLNTAGDLFVSWTISRFESVKQLHVILLAISLAAMVLFVLLLYRPYIRLLHRDTKAVAGMLSQLPAEVDVEGHVKTVVLGIVKAANDGNRSMVEVPPGFAGAGSMAAMPAGMMVPAGYASQSGMGMGGMGMGLVPAAGSAPAAGASGWFSQRRTSRPLMVGGMGYMLQGVGAGNIQYY